MCGQGNQFATPGIDDAFGEVIDRLPDAAILKVLHSIQDCRTAISCEFLLLLAQTPERRADTELPGPPPSAGKEVMFAHVAQQLTPALLLRPRLSDTAEVAEKQISGQLSGTIADEVREGAVELSAQGKQIKPRSGRPGIRSERSPTMTM